MLSNLACSLVIHKSIRTTDSKAKELIDQFILVCNSFCSKKNEMQEKLRKLTPENEKVNNWKNLK